MQTNLQLLIKLLKENLLMKSFCQNETRRKLLKSFAMLENKKTKAPKRKHGNIPLQCAYKYEI